MLIKEKNSVLLYKPMFRLQNNTRTLSQHDLFANFVEGMYCTLCMSSCMQAAATIQFDLCIRGVIHL